MQLDQITMESDIKIPKDYFETKSREREIREAAVSSMADFMVYRCNGAAPRTARELLCLVDSLRDRALSLVEEAMEMSLDIIVPAEDPDSIE